MPDLRAIKKLWSSLRASQRFFKLDIFIPKDIAANKKTSELKIRTFKTSYCYKFLMNKLMSR